MFADEIAPRGQQRARRRRRRRSHEEPTLTGSLRFLWAYEHPSISFNTPSVFMPGFTWGIAARATAAATAEARAARLQGSYSKGFQFEIFW